MLWICLLWFPADLQDEANQAFVNHVVANHWAQVADLEERANVSRDAKEKRQLQREIREAKGAKRILQPGKGAFTDLVSWERRRTGTRQVLVPNPSGGRSEMIDEGLYSYAFSVDWKKAAPGDCLHVNMSYSTGSDGGTAIAPDNVDIYDAQGPALLAHPVNWRLGSGRGELVPTTEKDMTLRLVEAGKLRQRNGRTVIDGFWHVAAVQGNELTLIRVDRDAIEKQAKAKIRTGKPKAAQNL